MNPVIIGRAYRDNMKRLAGLVRMGKVNVSDATHLKRANRCYSCHTQPVNETKLLTYVHLQNGAEVCERYVVCRNCLEGMTSSN